MSNAHRLAWIDSQIRGGRHPNATTMARRFEISRRQAARDIEYLRHSLGAPLAFSPQHNGYYYAGEGFVLPTVVLSQSERSALSYLAQQYARLPDRLAADVAALLQRLSGQMVVEHPSPDLPPVASIDGREMRAVEALEWAIENRRKVIVRYRGLDGVIVPRTLSPLAIRQRHGMLSCAGYYEEPGEILWLPLARFETVDATDDSFEIPEYFKVHDDPTVPPESFHAVVRLEDPRDAERLESAVRQEDGTFKLDFRSSVTILSALLACKSRFEILSPNWLRARLLNRLAALLGANREGVEASLPDTKLSS